MPVRNSKVASRNQSAGMRSDAEMEQLVAEDNEDLRELKRKLALMKSMP